MSDVTQRGRNGHEFRQPRILDMQTADRCRRIENRVHQATSPCAIPGYHAGTCDHRDGGGLIENPVDPACHEFGFVQIANRQ